MKKINILVNLGTRELNRYHLQSSAFMPYAYFRKAMYNTSHHINL